MVRRHSAEKRGQQAAQAVPSASLVLPLPGGTMSGRSVVFRLSLLAVVVFSLVAACGGDPDSIKETRTGASGDRSKRDVTAGLGGRTQETGSLFGPGGLFGSKSEKKGD